MSVDHKRLLHTSPPQQPDSGQSLKSAITRDVGGVVLVWCADLGARAQRVDDIESRMPSKAHTMITSALEEALIAPDRLVLLVPNDEAATINEMEGRRDQLVVGDPPRTQPIVLFLMRDADGARMLREHAPSLSGVVRGNEIDPERLEEIDPTVERALFLEETGETPKTWLARWRAGELPTTNDNFTRSFHAMFLEET